ncbi:CHAT domain-containing protein [Whalleya microplaca]|nr:CHAT domain-containing protein [Whalleya microplaca]
MLDLSIYINQRYLATSTLGDLEESIHLGRQCITIAEHQSIEDLAVCEMSLGNYLTDMYSLKRQKHQLDEAIKLLQNAAAHTNATPNLRPKVLCNLGNALEKMYQLSCNLADLDAATDYLKEGVDQIKDFVDQPDWNKVIQTYSGNLNTRFQVTKNESYLDSSLFWVQKLIGHTSPTNPLWSCHKRLFCDLLLARYQSRGQSQDILDAVMSAEDSIESTASSRNAIEYCLSLCSLSKALIARYRKANSMADLNRAMDCATEAVNGVPTTHVEYEAILKNKSTVLSVRYERLKDQSHLDEAIYLGLEAYREAYGKGSTQGSHASHLGVLFGTRYKVKGDLNDLQTAVSFCEKALTLESSSFANHHHLAYWLKVLFQDSQEKNFDILGRAINHAEEALALAKAVSQCPEMSKIGYNVAEAYEIRFQETDGRSNMADRVRSKEVLEKMMAFEASPALIRINCALFRAAISSCESDWDRMYRAAEVAVTLLTIISPRSVSQRDQQSSLSEFSGLACRAASAAILAGKTPIEALQLLEHGRCLITNHRFEQRVDISHLKGIHPTLAERFEWLWNSLETDPELGDSIDAPIDRSISRRHEAERDLLITIDRIREVDGFDAFLTPKDPRSLCGNKAFQYIVVINISFRSDVFIVSGNDIRTYQLQHLDREKASDYVTRLKSKDLSMRETYRLLEWLWDSTAGPILDILGISTSSHGLGWKDWPRVCWVPTGPMSYLPLHAAGYHLDQEGRTVLDRVISSYSPSLKFLQFASENSVRAVAQRQYQDVALVASMVYTVGMPRLPKAGDESKAIAEILQAWIPVHKENTPSRRSVRERLHDCTIFHFAGHARAHASDPLQSCLIVSDGDITIEDLVKEKLHLRPPLLAYLSACSTGITRVDSLVDESIHLAGAFLAAGFQNVIASLWNVSDHHSADVGKLVYKSLSDTGISQSSLAYGLHRALLELRSREIKNTNGFQYGPHRDFGPDESGSPSRAVPDPYSWISHIHMGWVN